MIRAFEGNYPQVDRSAFLDETAMVVGDVVLGEDSSVWPMAVVRGDVNRVRIGARTNIQDGSILHVTHRGGYFGAKGFELTIGEDVTVGHGAVLHGCTVEDSCLIGMRATVMDGALVEKGSMVAAGALVSPGTKVTSGWLWKGTPARPARRLTEEEEQYLLYSAQHYVALARRHAAEPR